MHVRPHSLCARPLLVPLSCPCDADQDDARPNLQGLGGLQFGLKSPRKATEKTRAHMRKLMEDSDGGRTSFPSFLFVLFLRVGRT